MGPTLAGRTHNFFPNIFLSKNWFESASSFISFDSSRHSTCHGNKVCQQNITKLRTQLERGRPVGYLQAWVRSLWSEGGLNLHAPDLNCGALTTLPRCLLNHLVLTIFTLKSHSHGKLTAVIITYYTCYYNYILFVCNCIPTDINVNDSLINFLQSELQCNLHTKRTLLV